MIQHRGPLKNFFIYSAPKSKNKQITAQPQLVLSLKKGLFCFSKQINNDYIYLKKTNAGFIKQTLFLLKMLFIDFTKFIKQKFIKNFVFYVKTLLKNHGVY